jgi:hypothetical protein
VVARQDAQAPGRDRQRFVKTELGGKIGDGMLRERGRMLAAPSLLVRQVGVEILQHLPHAPGKLLIL